MEKTDSSFFMKPKIDFCFKELMQNPDVRKGFLAALLYLPPDEIRETRLLPTHLRKRGREEKLGILDVRIYLNNNTQIDVEIQLSFFKFWEERSIFYLCKMYTDQIEAGDEYKELEKCIHVGILDFELFPEDEEFYSRFHLWEDNRPRLYTDKLEVHVLELPKLNRHQYPETTLLKWARFINAEKKEELEEMAKTDEYIEKAYDQLVHLSADQMKKLEYEEREKAIRDYNHQVKCYWEDGVEAGKKEGIQELGKLVSLLLSQNRIEEIERVTKDEAYREQLYKEFEI